MAEHYYLISSLPMLSLDKGLPFSYAEFMDICRDHLGKAEYAELESAVLEASGDPRSPLMRKWKAYLGKVASVLKAQRAKKLGWNGGDVVALGNDPVLSERIQRAVDVMNPLEGEKEILAVYFDFLQSNSSLSPFSMDNLLLYALKLQILERLGSFDQEKGRKEFRRLFSDLQKDFVTKEG